MPNYLLLLHAEPDVFKNSSPEELQVIIQKYYSWKQRMRQTGILLGGEKLQDRTGRVIRRTADVTSVIDGPYAETKEVLAGFFQIQTKDYDAAVDAAKDCPHLQYGAIEIRQIEPVGAPANLGDSAGARS
jgi:hypothetical protein